ncbi:N-acetyl sugar amidotransferase [Flavobacterium branchiophilum NBRC 15030 = ATCC 35035]|uniref:N-acetyl sugar amidotransferase n=1 Tax=Flavobacterium branchiophilum TaxID=55197 RepID=A0A543G640_9FLAO|nr:N-acetyl sugar amidotransferase [Flavobacterium branchiophilum]OXA81125.1 N-acetyl sugar amidotransferase [Flavobacterium branchiophilum NBRC 15030 = ATCC 35035]TQM41551.1 N-acetyl sugar amidotransferase [Flavobacterium branchiophilum]GEM55133.1 LPS biosynthesis protein WbpG [Flavobacterium branchiophilum NBRC 15030 = ATCC 35035]
MQNFKYQADKICSRCIMDDTVEGITFNEKGECTFCEIHDELEMQFALNDLSKKELEKIVAKIKQDGKGKPYDCIVGVSGGRDSTYTLYETVKLGLRPLAVHFDNGWNTEHAVNNIKNVCKKLNVDLYTHVAVWEEFKDLQRAFLEASVPDAEVPTDWVIFSVLFKEAAKENLKYIIHGHSFRTEGTTPISWTYMDGRYVNDIHKKFGKLKIKSFPIMNMSDYLYYSFIRKIKQVRLLYYLPYDEQEVLKSLTSEVDWHNYGGKHHESKYTGFFQSYILTRKFNIDKRKLHYSALLRNGQITRNEALLIVKKDPFTEGIETINYCQKKLGYSAEEFDSIMKSPVKSYKDYNSYFNIIKKLKKPIFWATKLGIVPDTVYRKFFKF